MGAEDLIINGKNVVVVEYHINDVFETPYAQARQMYYYVTGLPTVYFDGMIEYVGGNNSSSMYSTYLPFYEERINILSDFSVDIQGVNSLLTDYVVNVTVENVAANTSPNLALLFTLTESDILYYWMGQEYVNYCERFMLPDESGTPLDFSGGNILDFSFAFSLDPEWEQEHCVLAIWVQDMNTKEVHQAAKRSLTELGGFPARDAAVKHIYTPITLCNDYIEPAVEVLNLGSENLTSLDIVYQVDNEPEQTYSWNGDIAFSETSVIDLPGIDLLGMTTGTFTARLENPNGQSDEYPYNDTLSTIMLEAENVSSPVTLVLKLDDFPQQTSLEVASSDGTVLYSGSNYTEPGIFVTETFDLGSSDCYAFKIFDSNGDGLTGAGLYKLMYGSTIFQLGKEFGFMDEVQFGIGLTQMEETLPKPVLRIYPNPVSGMLFIETQLVCEVDLLDMKGKVILCKSISKGTGSMDLSDQMPGLYLLRLTGDFWVEIHKVVVNK